MKTFLNLCVILLCVIIVFISASTIIAGVSCFEIAAGVAAGELIASFSILGVLFILCGVCGLLSNMYIYPTLSDIVDKHFID